MPTGVGPAGTLAGVLGESEPSAATSYCETEALLEFVAYALCPSGDSVTCTGFVSAARLEASVSVPSAPTL